MSLLRARALVRPQAACARRALWFWSKAPEPEAKPELKPEAKPEPKLEPKPEPIAPLEAATVSGSTYRPQHMSPQSARSFTRSVVAEALAKTVDPQVQITLLPPALLDDSAITQSNLFAGYDAEAIEYLAANAARRYDGDFAVYLEQLAEAAPRTDTAALAPAERIAHLEDQAGKFRETVRVIEATTPDLAGVAIHVSRVEGKVTEEILKETSRLNRANALKKQLKQLWLLYDRQARKVAFDAGLKKPTKQQLEGLENATKVLERSLADFRAAIEVWRSEKGRARGSSALLKAFRREYKQLLAEKPTIQISPYTIYAKDNYEKVADSVVDRGLAERDDKRGLSRITSSEIGKAWSELSADEKTPYKEEADKQRAHGKEQFLAWAEKLRVFEADPLFAHLHIEPSTKIQKTVKTITTPRGSRKLRAYDLFARAWRDANIPPGDKFDVREHTKQMAAAWRDLSPADKAVYEDEAKKQ